jgi:hypothetical protein
MIEDSKNYQLVNAAFPHIGKKIKLFWGYPEFVTMMLQLQTDTRGGKRQGFPGDVLFALMDLEEKHDIEFPHLKRQIISNWHTL